jgi:hypothetical protein
MSNEPASHYTDTKRLLTLYSLAASQHVVPLRTSDDLVADLWDSDEELDRFLAAVREDRRADLAGATSASTPTSRPCCRRDEPQSGSLRSSPDSESGPPSSRSVSCGSGPRSASGVHRPTPASSDGFCRSEYFPTTTTSPERGDAWPLMRNSGAVPSTKRRLDRGLLHSL